MLIESGIRFWDQTLSDSRRGTSFSLPHPESRASDIFAHSCSLHSPSIYHLYALISPTLHPDNAFASPLSHPRHSGAARRLVDDRSSPPTKSATPDQIVSLTSAERSPARTTHFERLSISQASYMDDSQQWYRPNPHLPFALFHGHSFLSMGNFRTTSLAEIEIVNYDTER
jgi:hypothetical protein